MTTYPQQLLVGNCFSASEKVPRCKRARLCLTRRQILCEPGRVVCRFSFQCPVSSSKQRDGKWPMLCAALIRDDIVLLLHMTLVFGYLILRCFSNNFINTYHVDIVLIISWLRF